MSKTPIYAEQISNTVRYDSPALHGFRFGASYSPGEGDPDNGEARLNGNDGFAVSLQYDNGPLLLLANFDRRADSGKSWLWNAGAAYTLQGLTVSFGYQDIISGWKTATEKPAKRNASTPTSVSGAGLHDKTGSHPVNVSFNRGEVETGGPAEKVGKYALGYTVDLSKRTSLYASIAFSDFDNEWLAGYYLNDTATLGDSEADSADASVTGIQFGITHRF